MFNFIFRPPSKICRNIFLGKFNCFDYSVAETSDFWLGAQFSYDKRNNSPLIVFFLNRRFDINNLVRFYADACLRFYNSFYTLFNRLTISNQIMTKIKKTIRIFFNTWWRFVSGDTLSPQRNIFSIPLQNYLKSNMCPATYLIFQWLTKISFFVFPNVSEVHKLFGVSTFSIYAPSSTLREPTLQKKIALFPAGVVMRTPELHKGVSAALASEQVRGGRTPAPPCPF